MGDLEFYLFFLPLAFCERHISTTIPSNRNLKDQRLVKGSILLAVKVSSNPTMHIHFISRAHLIFYCAYIKLHCTCKIGFKHFGYFDFPHITLLSGLEQGQSSPKNLCVSGRHPRQCTLDITCRWTI